MDLRHKVASCGLLLASKSLIHTLSLPYMGPAKKEWGIEGLTPQHLTHR